MYKKYYFWFLALFILVGCATPEPVLVIEPAKVIKRTQAVYPTALKRRGVEGFVKLRFTLTTEGTVANPEVIESQPEGVFDSVALDAIRKVQYKPRMVNGYPQAVTGMTYRYYFDNSSSTGSMARSTPSGRTVAPSTSYEKILPIVSIKPIYPQIALDNNVEGYVTTVFTVNERGRVINARVAQSTPVGVFDDASLAAINKFLYKPRQVNGQVVAVNNVAHTFVFDAKKELKRMIDGLKKK